MNMDMDDAETYNTVLITIQHFAQPCIQNITAITRVNDAPHPLLKASYAYVVSQ